MSNKIKIILISIVSIFLIAILLVNYSTSGAMKKLKADITFPTENGLAFSCDKTEIAVNEEVNCYLVGHIEGGIKILDGGYNVTGNISTTITSNEVTFPDKYETGRSVTYMNLENGTDDDFMVATIVVKGTAAGGGILVFDSGKDNTEEKIKIGCMDVCNSDPSVDLDESEKELSFNPILVNFTVNESESSGEQGNSESLSSVCTLDSLTISNRTLTPSFEKNIYSYNATVPYEVSSITISGQKTDSNSQVTGLGSKNLNVGDTNEFEIDVLAQDGSTSNTYIITVTREAEIIPEKSSDNTLKSLTISGVTLIPEFSSSVTKYDAYVENNVTSVTVQATANDNKARLSLPSNLPLSEGNNTITINVTAENNSVKTYTVVVNRKSASGSQECVLELTSAAYKIDNTKQIIDAVNQDDTLETIKNNLTAKCGTIEVTQDKVIVQNGLQVKTYTIKRVFIPKTGQNPIKYIAIIAGVLLIIGILIFVKKKMDK